MRVVATSCFLEISIWFPSSVFLFIAIGVYWVSHPTGTPEGRFSSFRYFRMLLSKKYQSLRQPRRVHNHVHKSPPQTPLLSQMNPVHGLTLYQFGTHFNTTPYHLIYSQNLFSLVFRLKLRFHNVCSSSIPPNFIKLQIMRVLYPLVTYFLVQFIVIIIIVKNSLSEAVSYQPTREKNRESREKKRFYQRSRERANTQSMYFFYLNPDMFERGEMRETDSVVFLHHCHLDPPSPLPDGTIPFFLFINEWVGQASQLSLGLVPRKAVKCTVCEST